MAEHGMQIAANAVGSSTLGQAGKGSGNVVVYGSADDVAEEPQSCTAPYLAAQFRCGRHPNRSDPLFLNAGQSMHVLKGVHGTAGERSCCEVGRPA